VGKWGLGEWGGGRGSSSYCKYYVVAENESGRLFWRKGTGATLFTFHINTILCVTAIWLVYIYINKYIACTICGGYYGMAVL
jgi:hypothetical protein